MRPLGVIGFGAGLALSAVLLLQPAGGGEPLPVSDKLLHAGLFAGLGVLGWLSGLPRPAVAVGLLGWAVLSELAQHLMALGRVGDPLDLLANLAGLGAALVLVVLARRLGVGPRP